jgi:hypothetical protein
MKYLGLHRTSNPFLQPEGTSPFIYGCEVDRVSGSIVNEKGNQLLDIIPSDRLYISSATLDEKIILCLTNTTQNINFLAVVENGVYYEKFGDELGYTTDQDIKVIPFYSSKNELICIVNDGIKTPRIINLDDPTSNLASTALFSDLRVPDFSLIEVGTSGNLKTGAYYVALAYSISDYVTNRVYLSKPVIISSIANNAAYDSTQDKEESVRTNRSITFSFTGLDVKFSYAQISIIRVVDGQTTAIALPKIRINSNLQSSLVYTYTGFENYEDQLVEEILIDTPSYKSISDLTLMNNSLIGVGVTTERLVDNEIQKVANQISVKPVVSSWVSLDTVENSHKDSKTLFLKGTFMPNEVYAFYITPILHSGEKYKAFHIPGRLAMGNDKDNVSTEIGVVKRYKVTDTSTGSIIPFSVDRMGYWENESEMYPEGFPDFAGQNVRHHRMPSLKKLGAVSITNEFSPSASGDKVNLFKSGFKSNFDSTIHEYNLPIASSPLLTRSFDTLTATQNTFIKLDYSYSISLGKVGQVFESNALEFELSIKVIRTNGQVQVIEEIPRQYKASTGKIFWHFSNQNNSHLNLSAGDKLQMRVFVRASNYSVSMIDGFFDFKTESYAAGATGFISAAILGVRLDNIVFPEEIKDKIQAYEVGYAKRNEKTVLGQTQIYPNGVDGWYKDTGSGGYTYRVVDQFRAHPFEALVDRRVPGASYIRTEFFSQYDRISPSNIGFTLILNNNHEIKKINDLKLIPGNNTASIPRNKHKEEYLSGNLEIPYPSDATTNTNIPFVTLCSKLDNIYISYANQQIVSTGRIFHPDQTTTGELYAGDAFVNMYGVRMTYGDEDNNTVNQNPQQLNRNERMLYYPVYSNYNIGLRASGKEWHETFYPLSGESWGAIIPENLEPIPDKRAYGNYYAYNKDYNAQQYLKSGYPSDRTIENEFPFRVIKSINVSRESDYNLLRKFLAADYYEMPKNKGVPLRLEAWGDRLLIHCKLALFVTRDSLRVYTDARELVLGTGNLFEMEPQELIPTNKGFAGLQNRRAAIMTPAGYAFCDNNDVYLFNGQNLMNINFGLKEDLRYGITSPIFGYNPHNSQIYLTWTHHTGYRITASYIPYTGFWGSFHPYKPTYYIHTKDNFYSLKNNKLYRHNSGAEGLFYGEYHKSIIDYVFTDYNRMDKILEYISVIATPSGFKFDEYAGWTEGQHTGIVPIVLKQSIFENYNAFRDKDKININRFIDIVTDPTDSIMKGWEHNFDPDELNLNRDIPWYDQKQLTGKYFIVRLISNNSSPFQLHDISVDVSPYLR